MAETKGTGPIRVLHVISGLGAGGAERLLAWSARHHDRERFPMGVVSLMSGGELSGEVRAAGVPLVELGQERGRLTPRGFSRLVSTCLSFRPHVLQGHMFHGNLLARLVGRLPRADVRVVDTVHTAWEPWHRRLAYAATAPLADGAVAYAGGATPSGVPRHASRRAVLRVPYGIEIPPRPQGDRRARRSGLGLASQGFLWVAVGRLTRAKGFVDLVDAFSRLPAAGDGGPHLAIAGEGEERAAIERAVGDRGLAGRVRLLGHRRDVPEVLAAADAFVLSSRLEGNPLVVLEAMAAGLPVAATRAGNVPDLVEEERTAVLAPCCRPDMLARAMAAIMDGDAAAMGAAGRARLEDRFDFRRTQGAIEAFYLRLLGRAA